MARMQRSLFAQLNALAEEISQNAEKVAAAKQAAPVPADPGGYKGPSSHPSVSVDNDVQEASTGERASEYEEDIKKQQGAPAVDNTPEMSQEGRQDDVQLNIGVNVAPTGEDPAAEKDYKGTKDDPGTSHPAKTEDGEKYSQVSFKEAHATCSTLGNEILADLINFGESRLSSPEKEAGEMPAALKAHAGKKENNALKGDQHKLDVDGDGKIEGSDLSDLRAGKEASFNAGYELAAALGMEKEAAEAGVRDVCANTLREADEMAELFTGWYTAKQANDDESEEGEDHDDDAHEEPDGAEGEAMAAMPEVSVEEMMGGGEEMPGLEEAPPSEEEALQELAMALQELGIPPEALMQEMGPPEGATPEMGAKVAAANSERQMIGQSVLNFMHTGNFEIKEARTKRSRQLRDIMKAHVREIVSR